MGMLGFLPFRARHSSALLRQLGATALIGLFYLAFCAGLSVAAPRTVGNFSIELPAGWKAAGEQLCGSQFAQGRLLHHCARARLL